MTDAQRIEMLELTAKNLAKALSPYPKVQKALIEVAKAEARDEMKLPCEEKQPRTGPQWDDL